MHAIDLLTICYNYTLYIVIRTHHPATSPRTYVKTAGDESVTLFRRTVVGVVLHFHL